MHRSLLMRCACAFTVVTIPLIVFFPNSSSPDSLTADRTDKSSITSPSPVALYKLVVPLLRCEVADIRDAAVNALSLINQDALK